MMKERCETDFATDAKGKDITLPSWTGLKAGVGRVAATLSNPHLV